MIVDIGSLMFNMDIEGGGGTPSWGTDLGQSRDHKFLNKVNDIMIGMVYKSVSNIHDIFCPLGKGGARQNEYDYVLGACFEKIFVNNREVTGASFALLIVKKLVGDFHVGRRTLKYSPRITYKGSEINSDCFEKMKQILGLNDNSAWFVYDIEVKNQDELHFSVIIADKDSNMEFETTDKRKEYVKDLLKDIVSDIKESSLEDRIIKKYSEMDFSEMQSSLESLYEDFRKKYSPSALEKVSDSDLPRYMFYSESNNKNNLCWNLEFNPKIKNYFGAIGGGTAYLYGLHYSQKHKTWMTGTTMKPQRISFNEAIEKAKSIRQILKDAVQIVEKYNEINDVSCYAQMHNELLDTCGDLVDKLWVKKYLHMMFPDKFSTYYNYEWLTFLNRKCGFEQHEDLYEMSGELAQLAKRVELDNAIVSKILFELMGYPHEDKNENSEDDKEERKSMVVRTPRTNRTHPLNAIVYGAPGTGKTYSMKEYAVAIIEGRKVRAEQLTDEKRQELNEQYKKFVADGQVVFTTFHQSYGYEDFIQGLRPETTSGAMDFVPVDGVFKRIADKAMQDTTNNYVIIIDEINRGNISKVFGELITLIEDDKRWGEKEQLSVILPSGQEFAVPNNLYIVGTMNSADKSIALIDTALRRRFDFIEVAPNEELIADETLKKVLVQLNSVLRKQLESSDLLVGHAYFIGKEKSELAAILNRNIIPLLYEYYYDNEKKVKDALAKAIEGTDVEIVETIHGRIRVK